MIWLCYLKKKKRGFEWIKRQTKRFGVVQIGHHHHHHLALNNNHSLFYKNKIACKFHEIIRRFNEANQGLKNNMKANVDKFTRKSKFSLQIQKQNEKKYVENFYVGTIFWPRRSFSLTVSLNYMKIRRGSSSLKT